ncbi:MFS transporter [Nocardioides marmoribigeumensis]|uniref:MFS family permease n=1 Tax=Nocardioides marmoribigeumensis TaxID=433649 RepID=A0ABU2BYP0_9ACTN|nr:MFS transporter [Nocardioides marmoribigeumensis]MDR7363523.1 MFS family permease [Nocardioides marmoribigeumensis]
MTSRTGAPARLGAWGFVAWFGIVALLGDILYEGARSITGPLLASFGASAALVGLVSGIGEGAALLLRLVSGPAVDHSGRFWEWTIAGYVITAVSVPFLGLASALWIACALVILERVGKAVRAPAKDTLLSHATAVTGRGRGFAVHEALDQFGALVGPLLVAGMLWLTGDDYGPSLLVLAVPGVGLVALVLWLRRQVPDPAAYEDHPAAHASPGSVAHVDRLPGLFWAYAGFTALTMAGFATFSVLSFHLVTTGMMAAAVVPLLYAGAQLVDAAAALLSGWGYDARGPVVLFSLPAVAALVPVLGFSGTVWVAAAGCLLWGVALGIQESTMRATVADLVGPGRRATAYGVFAAVVGVAATLGGTLAGALYDVSVTWLFVVTVALQLLATVVLALTLRRRGAG